MGGIGQFLADFMEETTTSPTHAGLRTSDDKVLLSGTLTQSKLSLVRAKYERAAALVSLRHALGTAH